MIKRIHLDKSEYALIYEIRQLQTSGFRGSLQLHFPGTGGSYSLKIVPAARMLKSLSDNPTNKDSIEAELCQSESK
jgi:hypothetical protein